MNAKSALDSLCYIKIPKNFSFSKDAVALDANIPLPVQKKIDSDPCNFDIKTLSAEQILSGILTILAYDPKNEHADYYKKILISARPKIKLELCEAAIIKTKNEDFELAEEIFLALKGLDSEDVAITVNIALFFEQRADFYRNCGLDDDADAYDELALENYKNAMQAQPPAPDAYFNAGFFFLKKRDFFRAREAFESFLALTCETSDEVLGENGAYKKERAQEILYEIKNQNLEDERFETARRLIFAGREEKALEELRSFLQNNADVWNAWFMLGWALRRLCRYDDAKKAFEKAIQLGGKENSDVQNEFAICLMETGDLKGAKKHLEKALFLAPENTKIMSNLGFLEEKCGNQKEAQKYFRSVLEYNSQDKIALSALAKMKTKN